MAHLEKLVSEVDERIRLQFETADIDKITTDVQYLKQFIENFTVLFSTSQDVQTIHLITLNLYIEHEYLISTSLEMKGYLKILCFDLLNMIDYELVFSVPKLHSYFNNILMEYFNTCNTLESLRLYEAFIRCYSTGYLNGKLFFFEIQTVNQLFKCEMYDNINDLIERYKLCDIKIDYIEKCAKEKLSTYFHQLGYTCILIGSYQKAYDLFFVTLSISVEDARICDFQMILSEFVLVSLFLNEIGEKISFPILKYKNKINAQLMESYQSYQSHDVYSFAYNFYIYMLKLQEDDNMILVRIFNEQNLVKLILQIIENKLKVKNIKSSDLNYKNLVEIELKKVFTELEKQKINVPQIPIEIRTTKQQTNSELLLSDAKQIMQQNQLLKKIYSQKSQEE